MRLTLADLDGLGARRPHDLRPNVVIWDVSRGVVLEIAGKKVGHRSRRSTEVYAPVGLAVLPSSAVDNEVPMRWWGGRQASVVRPVPSTVSSVPATTEHQLDGTAHPSK